MIWPHDAHPIRHTPLCPASDHQRDAEPKGQVLLRVQASTPGLPLSLTFAGSPAEAVCRRLAGDESWCAFLATADRLTPGRGGGPLCQDQVRHQGQPLLVELEG